MPTTRRARKPKPASISSDSLLEILPDGIIILDGENRIVTANPAAMQLIGGSEKPIAGKPLPESASPWPEWCAAMTAGAAPITVPSPWNPHQTLEIRRQPIPSGRGKKGGSAIFLRDVTDRVQMENDHSTATELLLQKTTEFQTLHSALRLQAIHDPLTHLYNRDYLNEMLSLELARAIRSKSPVSILMMHLDQFDKADEQYGEKAGIEILKIMGSILFRFIRKGDVAGRYSGDDFVVVLPGAPLTVAGMRAEQLRKAFHDSILNYLGSKIECSFSCGVASSPAHGESPEEILRSAGKSLEESRAAGGDRVTVCE